MNMLISSVQIMVAIFGLILSVAVIYVMFNIGRYFAKKADGEGWVSLKSKKMIAREGLAAIIVYIFAIVAPYVLASYKVVLPYTNILAYIAYPVYAYIVYFFIRFIIWALRMRKTK